MTEAELIEPLPLPTDRWDIRNWVNEAVGFGVGDGGGD